MTVLGRIADVVTILAALGAFFGAISLWLTRPRIQVAAEVVDANRVRVSLLHEKGWSPAKHFHMGWKAIGSGGRPASGEGRHPWVADLLPREHLTFEIYDPEHVDLGSATSGREVRITVGPPHEVVLYFTWQHPLVPWLSTHHVVRWRPGGEDIPALPKLLRGRAAKVAWSKTNSV